MGPRRTTWDFFSLVLITALTLLATQSESTRITRTTPGAALAPAPAPGAESTKWAVLVAGSNGYHNFRHQADVCHAYQILKSGGLKDENIIVFMYDDIAHDPSNPTPGIIINQPKGPNVYAGVPKDYTGMEVTAKNLYAVLLGDKTALTGGSGKVLNSGPNDHVFFYFADHGGTGLLAMPEGDYVYADELMSVLGKMHDEKRYASMVMYVEACESGSMFEGLLPSDIGIYVTTAANPTESSWAYYCPGSGDDDPDKYGTCLGDLYSISWMEDCDAHDLRKRTLEEQYQAVKTRTTKSQVMQYGNVQLSSSYLSAYMGEDPRNISSISSSALNHKAVLERDADLVYFQQKVEKLPRGSSQAKGAQKMLDYQIALRKHVDSNIMLILSHLFNDADHAAAIFTDVRSQDGPVVHDWDCFKTMVRTYETHCGRLGDYGTKYARLMATLCNAGIDKAQMVAASIEACSK